MRDSLLIAAFFLVTLSSCESPAENQEVYTKYYANGVVKEERIYDRKEVFSIISYYPNGNIEFKGDVENKKFVGAKISYYVNGFIKEIDSLNKPCQMNMCCCDGKVIRYYPSGILSSKFANKDGEGEGTVINYDSLGFIEAQFVIHKGKKNGICKSFYRNGRVCILNTYSNDTPVGYEYHFRENEDTLKYFNHFKGQIDLPYKKWLPGNRTLVGTYYNGYDNLMWVWYDSSNKEVKNRY